jgi:O-antigen/teichoic acid export membrane protein
MSRHRLKIISGISIDTLGTFSSMLIGILALPFVFNYLSKEQYGLWLAISALLAMISVVDMGTDQYLTTVVADDSKFYSQEIGHHIFSTLIVKFAVTTVLAGIGLILYIFIASLIAIEPSALTSAKDAYLIGLLAFVFTLFAGTISTILFGRHHFSLVNGLASLSGILSSTGAIFLLALGLDIKAFPIALLCAAITQYSILFAFVVKKYPHIRFNRNDFKFQNKKEMIKYSSTFQVLKWAHILRTQYIVIAINNLLGPSAVVLFNLTNRLPQTIMFFTSKIAMPFFPLFVKYFANQQICLISNLFIKINRWIFRLSLFAVIVTFVISECFVTLWVGASSFAGFGVLFVLCIYAFLSASMGAFGIVIFASKKFEHWIFWTGVDILAAIFLSYVLSFHYGLFGIILGFGLASLINMIYLFKIVLKQLSLTFREFSENVFAYGFLTNISTLLAGLFAISFMKISGWAELAAVSLIFILIHIACNEGFLILKSKKIGIKAKLKSVIPH